MYLIDREKNEAHALPRRAFSEMNFKERGHLQEWIAKNPDILGTPLLIIQKEFHGFEGTNERLDLLALDKQGNLVIIENKLDDSGRDVVWQALKYASYCAGMTKEEIIVTYQSYLDGNCGGGQAQQNLLDFMKVDSVEELILNSGDQSIILVAAAFRPEVTSTVMWLLDHQVRIACITVSLFQLGDKIFLDSDQILPPPDTEEYRIRVASLRQANTLANEEKQSSSAMCYAFWEFALPKLREVTGIYKNVSPTKDGWISGASGHTGINYNCVVSRDFTRAEIFIGLSNAEENKAIFDYLFQRKDLIESSFSGALNWDRLNKKKGCRISVSDDSYGVNIQDDWPMMADYLAESIRKMKAAFQGEIDEIMKRIKGEKCKPSI